MKLKTIIASAVASLTLAGCATHDHINKDEVAQIKSVAVVMYAGWPLLFFLPASSELPSLPGTYRFSLCQIS